MINDEKTSNPSSDTLRHNSDNKMYVYPQDQNLLGICIIIPAIVEFLRIFIAFLLAAPPSKIRQLEKDKLELQLELASIKSVQLELVRHSKLERKVIKIDKELETLKGSQQPKADSSRKILRVVRVSLLFPLLC